MKKLKLIAIVALAAVAFQGTEKSTSVTVVPGIYGVNAGYSEVKVRLNEDKSFRYTDRTVKPCIDITGIWKQEGGKVRLETQGREIKIFDTWKLDEDCDCIKSRKGLTWRRLCLVK